MNWIKEYDDSLKVAYIGELAQIQIDLREIREKKFSLFYLEKLLIFVNFFKKLVFDYIKVANKI